MKNKFQWVNVIIVSISHFINDVYAAFLSPIFPILKERLSLNYSQLGFLNAILNIPSLLYPLVGIFADKSKPRYFIIITPAVTAICFSALGLLNNYVYLCILLFVAGISSVFYHVPSPVMIKKLSGDNTALGMSLFSTAGELARTLGPLIIVYFIENLYGFENSYLLMGFGILASVILYFRISKIPIAKEFKNTAETGVLITLKQYSGFFIYLTLFSVFFSFLKVSFTIFIPEYYHINGNSLLSSAFALSVLQAFGVIGTLFSGPISNFIGRKNLLIIASLASPLFALIFIVIDMQYKIYVLAILGLFLFISNPIILAITNDFKNNRPSLINSMYMQISFFVSALTAYLSGIISDYIGLEKTYLFAAILGFVSFPFVLLLYKNVK